MDLKLFFKGFQETYRDF
jgi:hypothetical protein